jgi:hypothetical protein
MMNLRGSGRFSGIFLHKDISTVEVEESILYDIILIASIFMIIALCTNQRKGDMGQKKMNS